ncbi:MAG: TVP38/TMEM64 family protein [Clostridia bacterium]|nr:TVP38/TMEM64 family protein [Clostridia bacterium]
MKRNKRAIIYLALILAFVIALSFVSLLVLQAMGVIYVHEDEITFNVELFEAFKSSWYGWIIFILLQTILSMLLCVVPGASMAFILLSKSLYTVPWQAFLLSFVSVMIASMTMYLVGRFGGYKICTMILGEEDCEKSLGLLRDKGTVFFPLMMMFPIFPDDALVMIAGTTRMSLKWFIPSIVVGRGIGIATIIFGLSLTDYFTSPIHWIIFVILCIAFVIAIFSMANKLNKHLGSHRHHSDTDATASKKKDAEAEGRESLAAKENADEEKTAE